MIYKHWFFGKKGKSFERKLLFIAVNPKERDIIGSINSAAHMLFDMNGCVRSVDVVRQQRVDTIERLIDAMRIVGDGINTKSEIFYPFITIAEAYYGGLRNALPCEMPGAVKLLISRLFLEIRNHKNNAK